MKKFVTTLLVATAVSTAVLAADKVVVPKGATPPAKLPPVSATAAAPAANSAPAKDVSADELAARMEYLTLNKKLAPGCTDDEAKKPDAQCTPATGDEAKKLAKRKAELQKKWKFQ